jgi:hypothetical protein
MILALLFMASMGSAADVAKAQQLYEKAKYEKALKALGDACPKDGDTSSCERLRAFILLGLGRDADARAAFHRLLADNPDTSLGSDVAPKVQTLFTTAKREVVELQNLELDTIDTKTTPGSWVLKVGSPEGVELKALKAFIAAGDGTTFTGLDLTKEERAWVGTIKAATGDKLKYYLVATLPTDVAVAEGSEAAPLVRSLPAPLAAGVGLGTADVGGGTDSGGHSPFDSPVAGGTPSVQSKPLPPWAIWAIVGGAVAVAAVGVTLAIMLTRDAGPGTIVVGIKFVDL